MWEKTEELQQEVDISKQKLEVPLDLRKPSFPIKISIVLFQETAQSLAASMAIAQEVQQRAEVATSVKLRNCKTKKLEMFYIIVRLELYFLNENS